MAATIWEISICSFKGIYALLESLLDAHAHSKSVKVLSELFRCLVLNLRSGVDSNYNWDP